MNDAIEVSRLDTSRRVRCRTTGLVTESREGGGGGAVGESVWGWMTCIDLAQAKQQTQTKNVEKQQLCPLVSTLGLSGNRTNTCVVYHYLTQKRKKKKEKKKVI